MALRGNSPTNTTLFGILYPASLGFSAPMISDRRGLPRLEHHGRGDAFAEVRVRDAEHRALATPMMASSSSSTSLG